MFDVSVKHFADIVASHPNTIGNRDSVRLSRGVRALVISYFSKVVVII